MMNSFAHPAVTLLFMRSRVSGHAVDVSQLCFYSQPFPQGHICLFSCKMFHCVHHRAEQGGYSEFLDLVLLPATAGIDKMEKVRVKQTVRLWVRK